MEPRPAASQEMSITYVEVQLMCRLGSSITPGSHSGAIGVLSWDLLGYTSVACMGQDSFSGLFCFIHKPPILYYPLPDGVLNHLIEDDQNFTGIWLNFNTAKIGTPSVRVHFKVLLARPTCVSSSQNGMPSPHKYLPIPFFREICNRTSEVLKHSKHLCCFPQSPWIFYSRVLINLAFTKQKGT